MRRGRFAVALILFLLFGVVPQSGVAHPHVWINNVATFVFEGSKIVALRLEWTFDEFYGAMMGEEFDANRDRRFDAAEVATIHDKAFANLKSFNYFTVFRAGDETVKFERAENFSAEIVKGTVVYRFTLPLPAPVDPATEKVSLSVHDPTYYIEVVLDRADPVRYEGDKIPPCHFAIREDKENPIWFGMVFPLHVALTCGGS